MYIRPLSTRSTCLTTALLLLSLLPACSQSRQTDFTFSLEIHDSTTRHYNAMIQRPENPNGMRIMLVGGGSVTDIDWTAPGTFTDPASGQTLQFTIDANPTKDALRIANHLLAHGYTIWRFSSIYTADEQAAKNPLLSEWQTFDRTVDITRAALNAFATEDPGAQNNITIIAHSLGAPRSILIGAEDPRVRAFVFLAGAYLSNQHRPADAANSLLRESALDTNADDLLSPAEASALFPDCDIDNDNTIRAWEFAAAMTAQTADWPDAEPDFRPPGTQSHYPWPSDLLIRCNKPALVLAGSLDAQSVHAPILQRKARHTGAPIECRYFPDLGHQLSIERDNQMTHIDDRVLNAITDWLNTLSD